MNTWGRENHSNLALRCRAYCSACVPLPCCKKRVLARRAGHRGSFGTPISRSWRAARQMLPEDRVLRNGAGDETLRICRVQSRGVMASLMPPSTRNRYGTDTSRQRHDHSRSPSCDTAIESFDPGVERAPRREPQDGNEVEAARLCPRHADGAEGCSLDGAFEGGGSAQRCLPQAYAATAR